MNHSTPGLPVNHQLPESTQTHVHWVGGAIQPSHPLSSPPPPALNLSQHQGLFKWVGSSHQMAKVWKFKLQHQSFQWTPYQELVFIQPFFPGPYYVSVVVVVLAVKNPLVNARDIRDTGLIPGLGRSPGEGNGKSLQYSCLESFKDRGAWWTTAHGVAKSWTPLSD